jgi:iron complex outermembrane receptor protein
MGKSFRAPAAPELVSNGVHHGTFRHEQGDAGLRPEHGYQADFSWRWQGKANVMEINPFIGYFHDFIYLRPAGTFSFLPEGGQIYRYTQHDAITSGFEFFADYHPSQRMHVELMADAVWNYNLSTGLPLPFSPPLRTVLNLRYDLKLGKGWVLSPGVNGTAVADQHLTDRNELFTPGSMLLGMEIGLQQDTPDKPSVHFRVENLLDEVWYDHLSRYRLIGLPMQGRNFIVNLRIPLTIKKP